MENNTAGMCWCSQCGQMYVIGVLHTCGTSVPVQQPYYTYGQYIDPTVLERIAKALEKLVELQVGGLK